MPEIDDWMATGRFRVFEHNTDWLEEYRGFHRKNGKIVDKRDDIMKATIYASMMRRHGFSALQAGKVNRRGARRRVAVSKV